MGRVRDWDNMKKGETVYYCGPQKIGNRMVVRAFQIRAAGPMRISIVGYLPDGAMSSTFFPEEARQVLAQTPEGAIEKARERLQQQLDNLHRDQNYVHDLIESLDGVTVEEVE